LRRPQEVELVRPIEEGDHRSRDGVARRFGTRGKEQREESRQLLVMQA
jgi:hypothetical protein